MQRRVKVLGFRFTAWWIWRPSAAHIHKQSIIVLFCFLDENDGAECNERRKASQNRNAQRCFVYQATSFVFLPFGVEDCQSIHREAFYLILLFVFNPQYKSTPHSPRNNAISFKNKDRNGNWIFSLLYNAHTAHIVFPSQTLQTSFMTTSDGAFLEKSSDFRFRFHPSEYK